MELHSTVGVYSSGDFKTNAVDPKDLQSHIEYNLAFRPGRALFVDGACHYRASLTEEEVVSWTMKIASLDLKPTRCSVPYQ
jgi:hypothetical protein